MESTLGLPVAHVEATYLAWVDCAGIEDAAGLFLKKGVAVSPGSQFGEARFVRLNFATTPDVLDLVVTRIVEAVRAR